MGRLAWRLSAVARVDVDVLAGKIAGPHARGALAGVHLHNDRNVFREHLFVRQAFRKWMFATSPADENSCELDVHELEVERYAGPSCCREDAAPIGISAG